MSTTDALPWWFEAGPWIGWALVALGGAVGMWLYRRGRRRRILAGLASQRAIWEDAVSRVEPEHLGERVTLVGTLRARSEARLERPEDGAPALAVGYIHASEGPAAHAPWSDRCAGMEHAPGLRLALDDGGSVDLEGTLELSLGSSETARPRRRQVLPERVTARANVLPGFDALDARAPVAFRSLREGDRAVATGRLERVGAATDGGDYRTAAAAHRLAGGADPHDPPVSVGYARTPTLRGEPSGGELGAVIAGAATMLGILAAVAGATDDARRDLRNRQTANGHRYTEPFDAPPLVDFLGVLSPFHRDDALSALAGQYRTMVPASEASVRGRLATEAQRSCGRTLRARNEHGLHEEVLGSAARCDEEGAAAQELEAAFALGHFERAHAVLEREPDLLDARDRAELHVLASDWRGAAEALAVHAEERAGQAERAASAGPDARVARHLVESREADARRATCLRRSLLRRAGDALEPDQGALADDVCRAAWADALEGEARDALLEGANASDLDVLWMLAAEAGRPPTEGARPTLHEDVFDIWSVSNRAEYSGLHAAAREALGRLRHPSVALLRAQAALFEAVGGDPARARAFATRALETPPERAPYGARAAAASVLVFLALRGGDEEAAREVIRPLRPHDQRNLEPWIELLAARDEAVLEHGGFYVDEDMARLALSGDGRAMAHELETRPFELLDWPVLLLPLIDRNRDILRQQVRWGIRRPYLTGRAGPWQRMSEWGALRWMLHDLGDEAGAARARRVLDRHRAAVLDRTISVPLLLLSEV